MANIIYSEYLKHVCTGEIDLLSDPIYAMLLTSSYTPSTGHKLVAEITGYEATDALSSYSQGGALLTGKTLTFSAGQLVFDAADIAWNTSTITASGVALWRSGGSAADHHLICWIELGQTSSTNGTFQISWSASDGIFKVGAN